jgi:hypothetical protein
MINISFLVVLLVLMLLALVYGLGISFGLERLKNFSRSEATESLFNLVILVLLIGGLPAVQALSAFIASIGQTVLSQTTGAVATAQPSSVHFFQNLCDYYLSSGVDTSIGGVFSLLGSLYWYQSIQTLTIYLIPNGFGLSAMPYAGFYPYTQYLNMEVEGFILVGGIVSAAGVLLFSIYYLFPIFLFLGVLLRCFPWTRAAGGSLLSLFIAFYIIFPALLYPFSSLNLQQSTASPSPCPNTFEASSLESTSSITCLTGPGSTAGSSAAVDQFTWFVGQVSYSVLQLFGVIIAFIISFDLIERFGDLLGAPALRSGRLMQKVI